jgi:4'-phosphopantetheinyl transferase EntD
MAPPDPVFARLLGEGVACSERCGYGGTLVVHPLERRAVQAAVPKRRLEFLTGRTCARIALRRLGIEDAPLLPGLDRAPLWPEGVVGSITHTDGYCAAVAAPRRLFASIGIDAQALGAVTCSIWPLVFCSAELGHLERAGSEERARQAGLLFAAKEAVFKFQHPLTGRMIAFRDVAVRIRGDRFVASVTDARAGCLPPFQGRCGLVGEIAFAAASSPA